MSRIGKKPVELPQGVTAEIKGQTIEVKGPKGTRSFTATDDVDLVLEDGAVSVKPRGLSKRARQQWGLTRSMVENLTIGVSQGFKRELEIQGVGYRAQMQGKNLVLNVGFSHPVNLTPPDGISYTVEGNNKVSVMGINKQVVGEEAARIRGTRPPEPYKGKGIRYEGEYVRRKAGKAGKAK